VIGKRLKLGRRPRHAMDNSGRRREVGFSRQDVQSVGWPQERSLYAACSGTSSVRWNPDSLKRAGQRHCSNRSRENFGGSILTLGCVLQAVRESMGAALELSGSTPRSSSDAPSSAFSWQRWVFTAWSPHGVAAHARDRHQNRPRCSHADVLSAVSREALPLAASGDRRRLAAVCDANARTRSHAPWHEPARSVGVCVGRGPLLAVIATRATSRSTRDGD